MEKRKEYAEGDIISCPKCEGDDLDYDDAPEHAKCNTCGQGVHHSASSRLGGVGKRPV